MSRNPAVSPVLPAEHPIPYGLSAWAAGVWGELTALHHFEQFELVAFERALRWFDLSDQWLTDAEAASGAERSRLVKQGMDAATSGLRFWRTLKFADDAAVRRPGRPSGDDWSAKRKLQAAK